MNEIAEIPVRFGPGQALFGMLAQQPAERAGAGAIGCLVLNTGVNHRIGPHRINVKTARRLARAGIPTLRFDLSGIGDSVATQSTHEFRTQAVEDMKAALDHLEQQHGLRKFLVFGICSGAENALALALADPRVVGLLAFDGATFLTPAARIERKLRRMLAFPGNAAVRASYPWWRDLSRWLGEPHDPTARTRTLARLAALWPGRPRTEVGGGGIFDSGAPALCAAEHEQKILALVARGVTVSLMYSFTYNSTDRGYGMLGQLKGSPLFERVEYRFWPDLDHTATTLEMQQKLLQAVEDWATRAAFGSTEPRAPRPLPQLPPTALREPQTQP